jgi:hypothetical protein
MNMDCARAPDREAQKNQEIENHRKGGETMGIVNIEEVIAWQMNDGSVLCEDCAPESREELMPVRHDQYSEDEYAIICDQCRKRVQ